MRRKYGPEHFRQIGAKGGSVTKRRRGLDFFREIGRQGGKATQREYGYEHYARIGRLGGHTHGQPAMPDTPKTDQSRDAGLSED